MVMKTLTYDDAPRDWALCFQQECPLHETCLRYRVGTMVPATVVHHDVVLPSARQGDTCQCFATDTPVVIARGMKRLFNGMSRWEAEALRKSVMGCFSSRTHFYRYRDGEYPITPDIQARIARVFEHFKTGSVPHFDDTTEEYYFPVL